MKTLLPRVPSHDASCLAAHSRASNDMKPASRAPYRAHLTLFQVVTTALMKMVEMLNAHLQQGS